jgi:ribosomal protein S27E
VSLEFKTDCPSCGNHIIFPEEGTAQEVACPHCGKSIVLGATGVSILPMSEEQEETLVQDELQKKRDENIPAPQASTKKMIESQPGNDHPAFHFFSFLFNVLVVVVIAVIIIAFARFVLFWAFH